MLHTLTSLLPETQSTQAQAHCTHNAFAELGFIQNGSLFKEKAVFSHRIK
jgi:hypothetical protein